MPILKDELLNDPLGRGYAKLLSVKDYEGLANLLSRFDRSKTAPSIPRSQFQLAILPAIVALASKDDATQRKWDRILGIINSADSIDLISPGVQGLLYLSIQDGLLTKEQVSAIGRVPCTRAEEIGLPALVSAEQVREALVPPERVQGLKILPVLP